MLGPSDSGSERHGCHSSGHFFCSPSMGSAPALELRGDTADVGVERKLPVYQTPAEAMPGLSVFGMVKRNQKIVRDKW